MLVMLVSGRVYTQHIHISKEVLRGGTDTVGNWLVM